jgi:mono/diheme cytochrome c family protein
MRSHRSSSTLAAAGLALGLCISGVAAAGDGPAGSAVERGRYLVTVAGCNDCHSPGYMEKGGALPVSEWLTGTPVGYQGPWGTTYAANLRLTVGRLSEAEWLQYARQERLPPMPWFNLRQMTDADLKAIYAFIRSLGPAGAPTPAYVAPGGRVTTPYFVFVPQVDRPQAAAR